MSALLNVSLRVDKLPREKFVMGKDGAVYFNFTVAINDEANQFGQNVSAYDSQTKEEREAKKAKNYLANGSVVWTDGKITAVKKEGQPAVKEAVEVDDLLPF